MTRITYYERDILKHIISIAVLMIIIRPGIVAANRPENLVVGPVEISEFQVMDLNNNSAYSIRKNLQAGELMFSDLEEHFIKDYPAEFNGAAWIRTANASKMFKAETLMSFKVSADADVYVGVDDRSLEKPSWMSEWIDSGKNILAESPGGSVVYNLYKYKVSPGFAPGSTVKLGPNPPTAPTNYIVVVVPGVAELFGWQIVPDILAKIKPPVFADRLFEITEYGAVDGGEIICTDAFIKAIEACYKAGGGRVVVPEGTFLTGAIHLKSNVNLHVNGKIVFSRDPNEFLPAVFTTWEGSGCYNYSPFIYAMDVVNVGISGKGTIDGNADMDHWWDWNFKGKQRQDSNRLREYNRDRVPFDKRVFGDGHYLRPQLVHFINAKNVLVKDVTLLNSPFWVSLYTWCENVTVDGIKVHSYFGNNDGCNPEGTRYMHIKNCFFATGDDGVAIKAGRNNDGRSADRPSEYIVIQNCEYKAKDEGKWRGNCLIAMGSEMSGGIRDVYLENCKVSGNLNTGVIKTKSNPARGGYFMNIYTRNIDWSGVTGRRKFYIQSKYYGGLEWRRGKDPKRWMPVYHNININE